MKKLFKITIILAVFISAFLLISMTGNAFVGDVFTVSNDQGIPITYRVTTESGGIGTIEVGSGGTSNAIPYTTAGTLEIPQSVIHNGITYNVTRIGNEAFNYCDQLTSVTIPEGITSIGDYAFCKTFGLSNVTIPDSVTRIGVFAFSECALRNITISANVTNIGVGAFSGTLFLNAIDVSEQNSNYSSEGAILYNKDKTELLACPPTVGGDYIIPSHVKRISDYAFCMNIYIMDVTIPDSVTSIGEYAFRDCVVLSSITIPSSVTNIGIGAFDDCGGLISLKLPDGLTHINRFLITSCFSLTSVVIPESVTSIGTHAISNGMMLSEVHFLGDEPAFVDLEAFMYIPSSVIAYVKADAQGFATDAEGKWRGLTVVRLAPPEPPIVENKTKLIIDFEGLGNVQVQFAKNGYDVMNGNWWGIYPEQVDDKLDINLSEVVFANGVKFVDAFPNGGDFDYRILCGDMIYNGIITWDGIEENIEENISVYYLPIPMTLTDVTVGIHTPWRSHSIVHYQLQGGDTLALINGALMKDAYIQYTYNGFNYEADFTLDGKGFMLITFPGFDDAEIMYKRKGSFNRIGDVYDDNVALSYAEFGITSGTNDSFRVQKRNGNGNIQLSYDFTAVTVNENAINLLNAPTGSISFVNIPTDCEIGLQKNATANWVYTTEIFSVGSSANFPVFDDGTLHKLYIKLGNQYKVLTLTDLLPGAAYNAADYIYKIDLPTVDDMPDLTSVKLHLIDNNKNVQYNGAGELIGIDSIWALANNQEAEVIYKIKKVEYRTAPFTLNGTDQPVI